MTKPEVGDEVEVGAPKTDADIWTHSFVGHITDIIENMDCEVIYIIEDQDSDFYEMERDRFYIDGGES